MRRCRGLDSLLSAMLKKRAHHGSLCMVRVRYHL